MTVQVNDTLHVQSMTVQVTDTLHVPSDSTGEWHAARTI
jgi:hypothetical protein